MEPTIKCRDGVTRELYRSSYDDWIADERRCDGDAQHWSTYRRAGVSLADFDACDPQVARMRKASRSRKGRGWGCHGFRAGGREIARIDSPEATPHGLMCRVHPVEAVAGRATWWVSQAEALRLLSDKDKGEAK